ncbi:hypothetical protein EELLY_v1c05380 [Entomoplasma ellychniae]|uniref:Uncharacterized protein n=1 Tax=Entomoplasma ellychniae TaxID=2114 RepID=A0A8E2QWA3_9MOLU|nr:hypothetical protein [Entomoplasma ellychniae]PPE04857.1 hypothetical protein EELLY_v1c05380 [Entomoplasma ellychniae]
MKLNTWSFYYAKDLVDVKQEKLIDGDTVFVLLRPDMNEPNKLLGLGFPKENSATKIVDLQNKELSQDDVYAIFGNCLGMVQTQTITEIEIGGVNLSSTPIRPENIQKIIEVYSVFFAVDPQEIDSKDYEDFSKGIPEDTFTELDFNKIPLRNILRSLEAGMNEYHRQMNQLQNSQYSGEKRRDYMANMSVLQSNLILFFDNALRKVNEIVVKQEEELKKLRK